MNSVQNAGKAQWLIRVGALALVIQLLVFQNSIGIVGDLGVSGLLEDVLSGGLLLVAVVGLVGGLYLYLYNS